MPSVTQFMALLAVGALTGVTAADCQNQVTQSNFVPSSDAYKEYVYCRDTILARTEIGSCGNSLVTLEQQVPDQSGTYEFDAFSNIWTTCMDGAYHGRWPKSTGTWSLNGRWFWVGWNYRNPGAAWTITAKREEQDSIDTELDVSKYNIVVQNVTREAFTHPEWYEEGKVYQKVTLNLKSD